MFLVCSQTTHSSPRRCAWQPSGSRWTVYAALCSASGPGPAIWHAELSWVFAAGCFPDQGVPPQREQPRKHLLGYFEGPVEPSTDYLQGVLCFLVFGALSAAAAKAAGCIGAAEVIAAAGGNDGPAWIYVQQRGPHCSISARTSVALLCWCQHG
jgi:hypothetical protein